MSERRKKKKTIHISGQPFDTGRTQIDPERQTDREFECDCELRP